MMIAHGITLGGVMVLIAVIVLAITVLVIGPMYGGRQE
jgi:hypothetical protein